MSNARNEFKAFITTCFDFRGTHCWAGLTGQEAGLVGLEGEAENHLGLTAVSYEARTEDIPARAWRACGPSIAEEAMAKREVNHELTYCL